MFARGLFDIGRVKFVELIEGAAVPEKAINLVIDGLNVYLTECVHELRLGARGGDTPRDGRLVGLGAVPHQGR